MGRSLSKQDVRRIGRWCGWAAAALLLITMITGYGISSFRVVTTLTFGILDKATSQRWHHYTDIPVLVFLSVHVVIALWLRLGSRLKMRS
jgi:uncharacterized membrane protein